VRYSRLLEIARPLVEAKVPRSLSDKLKRWALRSIAPYPARFGALMRFARMFKPVLPAAVAELIPAAPGTTGRPAPIPHAREMVLLEGCVQAAVAPAINAAAREVFSALGIGLQSSPAAGCCGAVAYHLGSIAQARGFARQNIDAWSDPLERGAEAVVATSSGCAVMLKTYPERLADDPRYAARAREVAALVRDPAEIIDPTALGKTYRANDAPRIAFHAPCTLQHGLRANASTEACLRAVGFELTSVADAHLCCGSAGTYSLLQPRLAAELLDRKLQALAGDEPAIIASANIGCLMHLQRRADRPVMHWLELIRPHRVGP